MLVVNSGLTVTQLVCGAVANSLSLLGDGALMGMDSVCYAVGLFAERKKADARLAAKADRLGAMFSTAMLALTTCWVLFDVVDRLMGVDDGGPGRPVGEPEVEVDAGVMLGFTAVNLVADACVAVACWHFGVGALLEGAHDGSGHGASDGARASPAGGPLPVAAEASTKEADDWADEPVTGDNLNFFGAFAHLAADGVRGIAVMLAGILAVAGVVDATKADAYCSLFVCIFVLVAAASLFRTVLRKAVPIAYETMDEEDEGAVDVWPPLPRLPQPAARANLSLSGPSAQRGGAGAPPAGVLGRARCGEEEEDSLADGL